MNQIDLQYDPDSLLGPPSEAELASFRNQKKVDVPDFEYDPSYLAHIHSYHGGKPHRRCFRSETGFGYVIERFLNWVDTKRQQDAIAGSNVAVISEQILERRSDAQVPFAALFGGDYLCFDYSKPGRPAVIVWRHELSREEAPTTEAVAENFDEFLKLLSPLDF